MLRRRRPPKARVLVGVSTGASRRNARGARCRLRRGVTKLCSSRRGKEVAPVCLCIATQRLYLGMNVRSLFSICIGMSGLPMLDLEDRGRLSMKYAILFIQASCHIKKPYTISILFSVYALCRQTKSLIPCSYATASGLAHGLL